MKRITIKKSGQKIVVIRALANDKDPLGSGELPLMIIQQFHFRRFGKYKEPTHLRKGADVSVGTEFVWETKINMTDKVVLPKQLLPQGADVVIMSKNILQSGEGGSRTEIGLPGVQQELLSKFTM
jgi:beta-glucosidase